MEKNYCWHMENFNELSRDELLKLLQMFAKNWLAHDGSWFLAVEEKYGMETAVELDAKSWERFAVAEASRIKKDLGLPEGGGLKALEKALRYRMYSAINTQEIEFADENTLLFKMVECRVQSTRRRKNLPPFPCKPVGVVEFSQFAKTIDERIKTSVISCPPDPVTDFYCGWKFTIESETGKP
ncbi:MAG: DUF6125 family protein [Bacteroidetes bacterium]|nr:DUF6125 family protein [Bacteroidota bacterium]